LNNLVETDEILQQRIYQATVHQGLLQISHYTFKKTGIKTCKTLLDKNQLDQAAE